MTFNPALVAFLAKKGLKIHETPNDDGHIAFRSCPKCGNEAPATEIEISGGVCTACFPLRRRAAKRVCN